MSARIEEFISTDAIRLRVEALATEIRDAVDTESLLVVCVLKGSMVFFADLVRALGGDTRFDYIAVSSYGEGQESSGHVRLIADLTQPIQGKDVLIVEDIVDTGRTIRYLHEMLKARTPKSLRIVTLLDKPSRRVVDVNVDHVGFVIPDKFVVGYGLDFGEKYRALPFIAQLFPDE